MTYHISFYHQHKTKQKYPTSKITTDHLWPKMDFDRREKIGRSDGSQQQNNSAIMRNDKSKRIGIPKWEPSKTSKSILLQPRWTLQSRACNFDDIIVVLVALTLFNGNPNSLSPQSALIEISFFVHDIPSYLTLALSSNLTGIFQVTPIRRRPIPEPSCPWD